MQTVNIDPKLALKFWHEVSIALVHDETPDLSLRQIAIMLIVYTEPPPHTVRGLASQLKVTKPVITRALNTMGRMDLVSRRRDEGDRRNVLVQRTVAGALYIEKLADILSEKAGRLSQ